jgi:hypothetical protein
LKRERRDGGGELVPVRGEGQNELQPLLDVHRRDGAEVAVLHRVLDEVDGGVPRLRDVDRLREGQVEEEEEVALGRRGERDVRSDRETAEVLEVDDVEVEVGDAFSVVVQLEIGLRQAPDGAAVAPGEVDGDLDDRDVRRGLDGPLPVPGARGRLGAGEARQEGGEDDRDVEAAVSRHRVLPAGYATPSGRLRKEAAPQEETPGRRGRPGARIEG